ncbi:MAG: FAD-dependent oxidoreductase [Planctomycetes bacterium]|nr:FAD-dependent oxidoreductase [Planctomycetota bacterium]
MSAADISRRVIVVGGGIAGLAVSMRLAQAGFPVILLEASELGSAASARNQGWLHSGALFALDTPPYARACMAALDQTLRFCPECIEPDASPMLYLFSRDDADVGSWTQAWTAAGIPWHSIPINSACAGLTGLDTTRIRYAFQLPDRAIRTSHLLFRLAAAAQAAGVEVRACTPARCLPIENRRIYGVVTSSGEVIYGQMVILAGGSSGLDMCSEFLEQCPGGQADFELIRLKSHLAALQPMIGPTPFCIPDAGGLNHLPHGTSSVFGSTQWERVSTADDLPIPKHVERLKQTIDEFFPDQISRSDSLQLWAGTTAQALRFDQIEAGRDIWPAVIDHARHVPPVDNLISVFAGRATLWAKLAEDTRRIVRAKLDVGPLQPAPRI